MPKHLRNVYEDFAGVYISEFMEMMVLGCSGGLYGDVIAENEGKFTADDVFKFIRFQHGDNDYSSSFSGPENRLLTVNIKETCAALLEQVDHWQGRDREHYTKMCPHLIDNVKGSLKTIIG